MLGEEAVDELHLAHMPVDAEPHRLRAAQAHVQHHIPVAGRRRSVVGRVEPILYPDHQCVGVLADGTQAGGDVRSRVEDDALTAQVHEPRGVLRRSGAACS